jgi:ABC-2 type transport system permease protein/lipopolysaccharide transport system permease protein
VLPERPPPELLFSHRVDVPKALRELWQNRRLLRTLAERDFRVRYKQAVLGVAWSVIAPLVLMLVFTVVFTRIVKVHHGDGPYPLFAYLGLLPWTFFATSLTTGGLSLVTNVPLLNKVWCPREVFPLSTMIVAGIDTLISCAVLGLLFLVYDTAPAATSLWVPLYVVVQLCFTTGVVVAAAAVIVYLRDVRYAIPVVLQVGLFVTPVAWPLESVPSSLRALYVLVNPLAAVIDGYRRTVLEGLPPDWLLLSVAAVSSFAVLAGGYRLFKRLEVGIADVA